jgi:hypothetical protein
MTQLGDQLFDSTFPILQLEKNGSVSIAGTSILVRHRDVEFMVTAAHVLRDNGNANPLFLSFGGRNIQLDGPALMTPLTDSNDLDIAVFDLRVHPELHVLFDGYRVNSLEHPDTLPPHARSHYYIFGYPFRKATHDRKTKTIQIRPLDYITNEAENDLYTKYGANKETSLLVGYDPKNTNDSKKIKRMAPHPHGASGGPIFRVLIDNDDHPMMLIFEGIMTRWKDKKHILSTRKSVIKSFIASNCFP